jgi:hypothetical protein
MGARIRGALQAGLFLAAIATGRGQAPSPQTGSEFDCYVQAAEARMDGRKAFLLADSDAALKERVLRTREVQTVAPTGVNPRKIAGGMIYDWIGTVFIPGASLDRLVLMLRDYDHRAQYFPDLVASLKLACRQGENRFGFHMRMKEPVVMDTENDAVWERVDPQRWKVRSYATKIREVGKSHNYLLRLCTYWRFAGTADGVFAEAEAIELSGQFGSFARTIGSMIGINPEKSLKRSLAQMRESVLKPGLEFSQPPAGLPDCGPPVRLPACTAAPQD